MSGGDASEKKDPAIKLFGKTIPVPESHISAKLEEKSYVGRHKSEAMDMCSEITKTEAEDVYLEDSGKQSRSSVAKTIKDEDNQIIRDRDGGHANVNPNEEPAETSSVETDKVFKKPDKVLECPRCNSLDTKFCYFNNYNVHQPRHFCKHCQRYWTAGGTMRNVPLGAGRRKNKQLASQYLQLLVSPDAVPTTRIDIPDSTNQQILSHGESRSTLRPLTSSGTVQIFGPEEPLSETVATVHLADQKVYTGDYNSTREKREEPSSCGSSITSSGIQENKIPERVNEQDSLDQSCIDLSWSKSLHHYPVPPWVFPWNQFWNSGASMVEAQSSSELVSAPDNGNPKFQWCSSPMLSFPGFSTPSIPLQFLPISYWNCFPVWTAGTRHAPMVGSDSGGLKSCSANSSPTLGKHSRDATLIVDEKSEKCVLALKRVRSDDSDEASKSSLWATLGFNSN